MKQKEMKKKILFLLLLTSGVASAQKIDFGIKGGLAYNADAGALQAASSTYENKGEGKLGWQAGLFSRIHLGGVFIQPEVLYTSFDNQYVLENQEKINITKSRIDLPITVGTTFLGLVNAQVGPVFSYYLEDTNSIEILQATQDQFNVGLQFGVGVEVSKLLINARYEMGLGEIGSSFLEKNTNTHYNTSNRPSVLLVSVGLMF